MQFRYYIDADLSEGVRALRLNDFELVHSQRGPYRGLLVVNDWLVNGQNPVEVELTSELDTFSVKVFREPHDMTVALTEGDSELLLELKRADMPDDQLRDLRAVGAIAVADAAAPCPWLKAPVLELTDEVIEASWQMVERLRAALEIGDVQVFVQHMHMCLEHSAASWGMSIGRVQAEELQGLREDLAASDFRLTPLKREDYRPRLQCGGRLIEPRSKDGAAVIQQLRTSDEQGILVIDPLLGMVDGVWKVLATA